MPPSNGNPFAGKEWTEFLSFPGRRSMCLFPKQHLANSGDSCEELQKIYET
jgi:hypothetical protein